MTINERVKYIRKNYLNKNQTEFANQLGMKQTSVSTFEKNGATVSEQTIKAILLKYPMISEDWIRYEKGPMIIENARVSLDDYAESKGATKLDLKIIKLYLDLDPDIRKNLVEHFRNGLKEVPNRVEQFNTDECLTASNDEGTSEVPSIAASSDETISEEQFWEEVEPAEEKTTG